MNWKKLWNQWKPKPKPPGPKPKPPKPKPPGPKPPLPPPPSSLTPTDLDMDLFLAHNQERSLNGKPLLQWGNQLYQAARGHSYHMAAVEKMGHQEIGDGDPWQRIQMTGYRFQIASENVAAGYRSVEAVMAGWMNSQGHRANILGNVTEIGCSMVLSAKGQYYWTTVFATPARVLVAGMGLEEIRDIDSVVVETQEGDYEMSSIHIVSEDEEQY